MTDVVVPQDGVTSSADVHTPPLILSDHILWNYNVFTCKKRNICSISMRNPHTLGHTNIHTCYHPSAILIYSNPGSLALEDVIPTMREKVSRGDEQEGSKY